MARENGLCKIAVDYDLGHLAGVDTLGVLCVHPVDHAVDVVQLPCRRRLLQDGERLRYLAGVGASLGQLCRELIPSLQITGLVRSDHKALTEDHVVLRHGPLTVSPATPLVEGSLEAQLTDSAVSIGNGGLIRLYGAGQHLILENTSLEELYAGVGYTLGFDGGTNEVADEGLPVRALRDGYVALRLVTLRDSAVLLDQIVELISDNSVFLAGNFRLEHIGSSFLSRCLRVYERNFSGVEKVRHMLSVVGAILYGLFA